MERGFGCSGGKGKARGLGRGGGMGGGCGRGMGEGRGCGLDVGRQPNAPPAPKAVPYDTEASRPVPVASNHPLITIVDNDRCTGCEICIDACPDNAISVNGVAAVDSGLCIGCGACIPECPNEALSLGRLAGGRSA